MTDYSSNFESMDRLFHPRAVAVVGVSDRPGNQGRFLMEAMLKCGFKGDVYPVNPKEGVKSWKTYPTLNDIPGPVDHIIVSVPSQFVIDVIADAGKKGVRSASMFSSGFSESGTEEGNQRQAELIKVAKQGGVRLIGPNCMGFYCPKSGLSFRPDLPMLDGKIGFVSQSGGVAITGVFMGAERGLGFSKAISYGNESDLGPPELLPYLADDPTTEVILLYVEGSNRGRELMAAMKYASSKKPVFVLKGGLTDAGHRAVSSHTGALAGSASMWEPMIKQAGGILVGDLDELIDAAQAAIMLKVPAGKNAGILTISGGFGVFATDIVEQGGFSMPEFSDEAKEGLAKIFKYPGTSVKNPLDMAASFFAPKKYPDIITALNSDKNMDVYLTLLAVDYLTFRGEGGEKWGKFLVEAFLNALKNLTTPNVVVFFQTGMSKARIDMEQQIITAGFPLYPTAERAIKAVNRLMAAKMFQKSGR